MATLLDTTMAESEHAQASEPETDAAEEDDDFCFDAPSYYDLKNPSLERRYVNNADGYFSSPATSRSAPSPGFSTTTESTVAASHKEIDNNEPKDMQDTTMTEEELDVQQVLSNSRLLDDKEESFEEVFRHYASSSQSSATSSYLLHELDTSTHSSQTSSSSTPLRMEHKSRFSTADGTSKLMQPTQSYLRRMQAEQRVREQTFMEDVPMQDKPRVTRPRSPKLHTRSRPANPNDPSRMSSTSRELLKIQEERLHLQLEKLKIREFHEKTKVQRPPSNVHQRSTKQLTIPQTPHFEVDSRVRRLHSERTETGQDKTPIAAEKLLSRDFALPLPPHSRETRHPRTPVTPQLETSRRAATHRRPIEVVDHDAEELAKKFHARPLNKNILEPKSYPRYSPAKSDSKARLTQHAAPKSTTTARSVTRQSASEPAASVASELERRRKEREQRMKARQTGQTTQQKSGQPSIRRPVIPETPPLKSIQLHREYQENFRRRIEAEEEEKEKQRTFKAKPMRVTSTPARFEGSTKPLTEMKPFELPGDRYREHASERLEQKRREEEEHLQSAGTFRAKPMPVFEADSFQVSSSSRPLTHTESPMLATNRRAAERAAFEAAEKERREQEEAFRQQRELLERQLEEEEVKRMRRKDMIFHARPVPESKPFQLKHDVTPLTEPVSPIKHS
uniref:TPX2 C-terminal domain-containing protein n=1 Tax=Phytophthora ramorum TaxID=164328 RepID=H3GPI7_PHYRM